MEPFVGEIRMMGFAYAPRNWALCNGQQLPINQNEALFTLLGTNYGGNGQTTFALPDLRGRTPISFGAGYAVPGIRGGEESHTVTVAEMPMHIHQLSAVTTQANVNTGNVPDGDSLPAGSVGQTVYGSPTGLVAMSPQAVSQTGGSQSHTNMMPYAVVSFCIALQGIYPSRD